MSDDENRAACAGKWWLFDSTDKFDHEEARELCKTCPVIDACGEILNQERKKSVANGPEGTWAGQLITESRGSRPPGRPRLPREHGTNRGYSSTGLMNMVAPAPIDAQQHPVDCR